MPGKLPEALHKRFVQQFGAGGTHAIERAFLSVRKPTFRVNTLKTTDDAVMAALRDEAIQFERSKTVPHAFAIKNRTDEELLDHTLAKTGKIYLQGIASMLPPLAVDPKPDEMILDLCAAPGSKTTQMAAMMNNMGAIVACEDNEIRFQKLLNTIGIQGATNVEARNIDSTLLHHTEPEAFDKILADVPCSAEGRIDLNDQRSYKYWSEKNIIAHAKLQRRLLRSAVGCLKPGGTLVYSTCTLAPEENEQMMDWLITDFPVMKLDSQKLVPPSAESEGFFVAKLFKQI